MQQFLSNGGFSKMLWLILMFILGLGSMIILFAEIWNSQPVNPIILSLLSGILTHGATVGGHILGVNSTTHTTVTGPLPAVTPPVSSSSH